MSATGETVLGYILNYIRKHRLRTGDGLPGELELASETGVGRSSVREALAALKTLGIIESRKKGGIRILRKPLALELRDYLADSYDDREIYEDALEFRGIMEWGLGELIFSRIKPSILKNLKSIVAKVRTQGEEALLDDADKYFHSVLVSNCGNKLALILSHIYAPLFDYRTSLRKGIRYRKNVIQSWIEDHEKIISVLERKDRKVFLEMLNEHTRKYMRLKIK